jgi:thiol-disulfide isomerase/thioredoxin
LPTRASVPAIPKNASENLGPARVPSSVIVGDRVENFALKDAFNDAPWEFRTDRKGKLVLLDFWGSWCKPCLQTIPKLINLQTRFGNHGLEVIGIAYEKGGSVREQSQRVNEVCKREPINYRQLLGTYNDGDIGAKLRVTRFPTLILLDEQGKELWRHDELLSDAKLDELRRLIAEQLSVGSRL